MIPQVSIIMGSTSDLPIMERAAKVLNELKIPFEMNALSAHRTPEKVEVYAKTAKDRGIGVIIAGAGGAAHLAGVVAAHTTLPVVGVPMESKLDGVDSLLSTVQMPAGIPVATVAIGKAGAINAAILAAQILGLSDKSFEKKIEQHKKTDPTLPGTRLVPYQKDLLTWLGNRKLFISLVVEETYAMVPMEAQSVGTPVLYRHMPQSLTQTIGQSGLMFHDEKDLLHLVDLLLSDNTLWQAYSRAGLHNLEAHQHYAAGMDIGLRRVIRRAHESHGNESPARHLPPGCEEVHGVPA